jgi:hypothetical protein
MRLTSVHGFFSFFLVLAFLAITPGNLMACGKSDRCCMKTRGESKPACCQAKKGNHAPSEQKGNCGGDCSHCACPSSCNFSMLPFHVWVYPPLQIAESSAKTPWYFLNKIPKDVCRTIWLPPKIGTVKPCDSPSSVYAIFS